jgi:hypothetical protein
MAELHHVPPQAARVRLFPQAQIGFFVHLYHKRKVKIHYGTSIMGKYIDKITFIYNYPIY